MKWDDCSEVLFREMDLLNWQRLDQDFDSEWDEANWTLHHERVHEAAVARAYAHRLSSGAWPSEMPMMVRWLVALRLRAGIRHTLVLEAWGADEPRSAEELIERLAVRGWPLLRYDAHCDSATPSLVSSVDDPWDDCAPPVWNQ